MMLLTFGPFLLILIALAVGPLLLPRLWHRLEKYFLIFAAAISSWIVWQMHGLEPLIHTLKSDYIPFMTMMAVLSLISSLLTFHKEGKATPLYNTMYLFCGAFVANIIGTMAAAMVLWPPFSHLNRHQPFFQHGVVFFIFIVCNVGACLSPLGDPPLLVGYLRGLPFEWIFVHAWKGWFLTVPPLLMIFYLLDKKHNSKHNDPPYTLRTPPKQAFFMMGSFLAITLVCPPQYRDIALLAVGLWAWIMKGRFDIHILCSIAYLFFALFVALIPVQSWLGEHAHQYVNPSPFFNFWSSGLLSAFLDNTPTYIVYTQLHSTNLASLVQNKPHILEAISLGCVWMGALSYIGNAPNLIVRAYAHKHAPSFLGYMAWAWGILIPLFLVASWILW